MNTNSTANGSHNPEAMVATDADQAKVRFREVFLSEPSEFLNCGRLNFSQICNDNPLEKVQALSAVLTANTTIENWNGTLLLGWNNISDQEAASLSEVLKTNTTLVKLVLRENKIGPHGAASLSVGLQDTKTLKVLYLQENHIGDVGATSLRKVLQTNKTLAELVLYGNNIGETGAGALSEGLQDNPTLKLLNLSNNNIGDPGAHKLSNLLQINETLVKLGLSSNKIGNPGACSLSNGLKNNTTLTQLFLDHNNIEPAGAEQLSEVLITNTTLVKLGLANNSIGDDGADSFSKMLKTNKTLKELNLEHNNISDTGADSLLAGLENNTALEWLSLGRNEKVESRQKITSISVITNYNNIFGAKDASDVSCVVRKFFAPPRGQEALRKCLVKGVTKGHTNVVKNIGEYSVNGYAISIRQSWAKQAKEAAKTKDMEELIVSSMQIGFAANGEIFADRPTGDDQLGVKALVKAVVTHYCSNRKEMIVPSNVAYFGQWGIGKSFIKNLTKLEFQRVNTCEDTQHYHYRILPIDFNAWSYSGGDEIWAGLINEIFQNVELEYGEAEFRAFMNGIELAWVQMRVLVIYFNMCMFLLLLITASVLIERCVQTANVSHCDIVDDPLGNVYALSGGAVLSVLVGFFQWLKLRSDWKLLSQPFDAVAGGSHRFTAELGLMGDVKGKFSRFLCFLRMKNHQAQQRRRTAYERELKKLLPSPPKKSWSSLAMSRVRTRFFANPQEENFTKPFGKKFTEAERSIEFMVSTLAHLQGFDSRYVATKIDRGIDIHEFEFARNEAMSSRTTHDPSFKPSLVVIDDHEIGVVQYKARRPELQDMPVWGCGALSNVFEEPGSLRQMYETLLDCAKDATQTAAKIERDYIANAADIYDIPKTAAYLSQREITHLEIEEARTSADVAWGWVLEFEEFALKVLSHENFPLTREEREVNLAVFIDDLDRCTDGKSVQILEAVHLLFHETRPEDSSYFSRRTQVDQYFHILWSRCWYWFKSACGVLVSLMCWCTRWYNNREPTWSKAPGPPNFDRLSKQISTSTLQLRHFKFNVSSAAIVSEPDINTRYYAKKQRESAVSFDPPPVITQFMLDPCVTKEEVEAYFGNSKIHGLRWLEKVVQLPIGLHSLRPDQTENYLDKNVKVDSAGNKERIAVDTTRDVEPERASSEMVPGAIDQPFKVTEPAFPQPEIQFTNNPREPPEASDVTSATQLAATSTKEDNPAVSKFITECHTGFTKDEKEMMKRCKKFIVGNPRRIKRVLNLYSVLRQLHNEFEIDFKKNEFFRDSGAWESFGFNHEASFRPILFQWLVMCDHWPFRMTVAVRLLIGDQQKEGGAENLYPNVLDANQKDCDHVRYDVRPQQNNTTLAEFFYTEAQHYVYDLEQTVMPANSKSLDVMCHVLPEAAHLCRLDGDAEKFDAALIKSCGGQSHSINLGQFFIMAKYFPHSLNPAVMEGVHQFLQYRIQYCQHTTRYSKTKASFVCMGSIMVAGDIDINIDAEFESARHMAWTSLTSDANDYHKLISELTSELRHSGALPENGFIGDVFELNDHHHLVTFTEHSAKKSILTAKKTGSTLKLRCRSTDFLACKVNVMQPGVTITDLANEKLWTSFSMGMIPSNTTENDEYHEFIKQVTSHLEHIGVLSDGSQLIEVFELNEDKELVMLTGFKESVAGAISTARTKGSALTLRCRVQTISDRLDKVRVRCMVNVIDVGVLIDAELAKEDVVWYTFSIEANDYNTLLAAIVTKLPTLNLATDLLSIYEEVESHSVLLTRESAKARISQVKSNSRTLKLRCQMRDGTNGVCQNLEPISQPSPETEQKPELLSTQSLLCI